MPLMTQHVSPENQKFLTEVDAFRAAFPISGKPMSDSAFGDWAVGDHKFISSIRRGVREARWSTMEKVRAKMDKRRRSIAANPPQETAE